MITRAGGRPMVELALADRFFFLAYEVNGANRLHQRAINFGLAAALIAELIVTNWGMVDYEADPFGAGVLTAIDRRPAAPVDFTTTQKKPVPVPPLWQELISDPWRHKLPTLLAFLAPKAENQVQARLITNGVLTRDRKRYIAVDTVTGNLPSSRMWAILTRFDQEPITLEDGTLLTLADAAGLRNHLLDGRDPDARAWLDRFRTKDVPKLRPDIAELASHLESALGTAAMTSRH